MAEKRFSSCFSFSFLAPRPSLRASGALLHVPLSTGREAI